MGHSTIHTNPHDLKSMLQKTLISHQIAYDGRSNTLKTIKVMYILKADWVAADPS